MAKNSCFLCNIRRVLTHRFCCFCWSTFQNQARFCYCIFYFFSKGTYDVFYKNCNTFTDAALYYLTKTRMPGCYNRIERMVTATKPISIGLLKLGTDWYRFSGGFVHRTFNFPSQKLLYRKRIFFKVYFLIFWFQNQHIFAVYFFILYITGMFSNLTTIFSEWS